MDIMNIEEKKQGIYLELKKYVGEIIGDDILEELNVTPDSVFTKDIEMDSIEIVSFAEKVKNKYGDQVDFTGWLSSMSMEELINLSFGQIVNFIADAENTDK